MVVDKSDNRVRSMFASIAPKYDRMNHLLSMNVDRYWRWKTVHMVAPSGDKPILDVCTGTGDLALTYGKKTQGLIRVVGTDFCQAMLELANQKKERLGLNGAVTFLEADTQKLPFPENTFQIVTVAFGLRNVADTDRALREMRRVCLPGGRVAVLEFSIPQIQPIKAVYTWYLRHALPRMGQWLARNDHAAYSYLPASVGEFVSGPALADRMRAAGLSRVEYHTLTLGITTLYVGTK